MAHEHRMTQFAFSLATEADERELRRVLADSPMEGRISLTFTREPNFFGAAPLDGEFAQVIVGRDRAAGRIVGLGIRAINPCFVNQRETSVGYLSGLRVLTDYRRRAGLIPRGYRYLKELHQDNRTEFYLTTIAADNRTALSTIASGRAGLPRYEPLDNFVTLAINPKRMPPKVREKSTIETRLAAEVDRELIIEFLREQGPSRQFFPAYSEHDLFSERGRLRGLRPGDVVLAFRHGRLVGMLGAWDQSAFKQVVVQRYSRWLAVGRPFYNWAAAWRGLPTLPRVGTRIEACYAAIPVVAEGDEEVFERLLEEVCREMIQRRRRLLLLGLHEHDALLSAARRSAGMEYITRLYVVYWLENAPAIEALKQQTPYLELGSL
jgi:hypothetical protein